MSDELEESDEGESDKPGSESGSAGTFGSVLGGLLHCLGCTLCVTLSDDESCDGDWGLLVS